MYNSPIKMLITDIQHQIVKQHDEEIYQAVLNYIPNIDKAELIRALQYDRDQYEKGFQDGQPKWIPVTERLPEPFEIVYVYIPKDKRITDAYITRHMEWVGVRMNCEVTHWMPLPEPPEGE